MPQVDFYILDRDADDARLTIACRLAEKAMLSDMRVLVRAADAHEARRLDDLLWTFAQGSFVPHRIIGDDADAEPAEPVLIAIDAQAPPVSCDMLINLAPSMPAGIDRYRRIAELVDANAQRRQLGRERFRVYREHGCAPDSHNV